MFRNEEDSEACARAEKRYQAALREQEQLKTKEHLEHNWHIYSRYSHFVGETNLPLLFSSTNILNIYRWCNLMLCFKCL